MNKIYFFLFLLFFVSCNSKTQDISSTNPNSETNIEKKEFNLMKNGLIEPLKGNWVNTILLDSTLLNRKVQPYINSFCCNLLLSIEQDKSVNLQGLIDNGELLIQKKDSISFTLVDDNGSDFGEFKYLVNQDLIVQIDNSKPLFYYKRAQNTIPINIIQDEIKFKNFFVNQLFTNYFSEKEKEQKINALKIKKEFITNLNSNQILFIYNFNLDKSISVIKDIFLMNSTEDKILSNLIENKIIKGYNDYLDKTLIEKNDLKSKCKI